MEGEREKEKGRENEGWRDIKPQEVSFGERPCVDFGEVSCQIELEAAESDVRRCSWIRSSALLSRHALRAKEPKFRSSSDRLDEKYESEEQKVRSPTSRL